MSRARRVRRIGTALAASVLLAVVTADGPARTALVRGEPLANGVARTPPMGWDSWNAVGCGVDQRIVEETADALVASGMREAGYRYVVVDDCWFDPIRSATGGLRASSARFPAGMAALGRYLHVRGLLFGLYESPSSQTCAQLAGAYPGSTGSEGHEGVDARRFAAWGVDYLKYDWCSPDGSLTDQDAAFTRMRDAIAATGRPIVLSINPNSAHATTGPLRWWGDVANMWRTTQDVAAAWTTGTTAPVGVDDAVAAELPVAGLAAPSGFSDPDMLQVGRPGLSAAEQRSQLALWAMLAAPPIAGDDLRRQSVATRTLLTSPSLLAIDQDPLGVAARQVGGDGSSRLLARPLAGGRVAVALLDEAAEPRRLTLDLTAAGMGHAGRWEAATT